MSPAAAVLQTLAEALEPLKDEMAGLGITATIDAHVDRLNGDVVCSYTFVVPRAIAEKMASEPA